MSEPTPTVYSWYMPEIEELIQGIEYPTALFKSNYDPGLDNVHQGLTQAFMHSSLSEVFGVDPFMGGDTLAWNSMFPHAYYTNGSSEGLFHLIARHQSVYPQVPLYQFEGEYQGYGEYAKALGSRVNNVSFHQDVANLQRGVFIISVPSSINGNILINQELLNGIYDANHYVILDVAYAGMADMSGREINLHPQIAAVVGSMSKPFGLYYHRIGFLWSKDPVASLYGNRWFKNLFSIKVGEEVLAQYDAASLRERYRHWQDRACQEASDQYGVYIMPSDVWLLGHIHGEVENPELAPFRRANGYRLCLTPYYMEYAKHE